MSQESEDDALTIAGRAKGLAAAHAQHTEAFLNQPARSIRRTELARPRRAKRASAPPRPSKVEQQLRLGRTLGEGGMGLVQAAEQVSLGREVAVKSLRESFRGEQATAMLLQEAFIMGRIEHPNILPIHDLQFDESGEARLVLKRIEGVEWRELMTDAPGVAERFGDDDLLEWNLRVLMQVCNAVHFAHSRGIIHRDLKPANIMIGSFGEVYVMDWGLALSMEADEDGLLPLVEDAKQLAGTPQYMAPEMLGGKEVLIGPRTDVYLLGAMLYEIITDLPPHDGSTMEEILATVLRSRPSFPDQAPPELVSICTQAMDADPGWRFQSALDLRRAVQRFLDHTGSRRLVARAARRAAELGELITAATDGSSDASASAIAELFAQCRFGYQQALEAWPENTQAHDGIRDATVAVAQYELEAGNPRAASQLLSGIDGVPAELTARVEEALEHQANTQQRIEDLERFQRSADIATGSRDRGIVAGILGLAWTVAPLIGSLLMVNSEQGVSRVIPGVFAATVAAALLIMAFFGRNAVLKSRLTQHLLGGAWVAMVALIALDTTGWVMQLDPRLVQSLWPLTWFCVSAMLAITVDRRMMPMTLGFLGALVVAAVWPDQRFWAMTASNVVMTVNMYAIWRRPAGEEEESFIDDVIKRVIARTGRD